jgi:1-acyl-sn-glycerol-3-phosphate acyltransferase
LLRAAGFIYLAYFFFSATILLMVTLALTVATAPFDRNRRLINSLTSRWTYHYIVLNPFWRCTYSGLDNIDSRTPCVIVSNHQSAADIVFLFGLLKPFKWVSKESIFRFPVIGWLMRLNQYVCVTRGDAKSVRGMFRRCEHWLARGASVMMFPEGTRSNDGRLLSFKRGPFQLAVDANVPVVPIVVEGTADVLPRKARGIRLNANISVKVLPAVHPSAYGYDARAMCQSVHDLMDAELIAGRRPESVPILCQS